MRSISHFFSFIGSHRLEDQRCGCLRREGSTWGLSRVLLPPHEAVCEAFCRILACKIVYCFRHGQPPNEHKKSTGSNANLNVVVEDHLTVEMSGGCSERKEKIEAFAQIVHSTRKEKDTSRMRKHYPQKKSSSGRLNKKRIAPKVFANILQFAFTGLWTVHQGKCGRAQAPPPFCPETRSDCHRKRQRRLRAERS